MNINNQDILSGEILLCSKAANAIIKISDYDLKSLPYNQLISIIGFKDKEAIGGMLHLTNYRLIFKSHIFNRVKGKFSIFLPTIKNLHDTSQFITKKIQVITQIEVYEFVVWDVPALIQSISYATSSLTDKQKMNIKGFIINESDKIGEGLQFSKVMEKIALNITDIIGPVSEIAQEPLSLSSILNILELWTILEKKRDE
ncbi:GRAM domain-containing protein [Nostoc sp.]|uniref:GRAM domain-containing protein n=1 Tax=Nostoc sp. TaxID=1180 RepID=UPI002FF80EA9